MTSPPLVYIHIPKAAGTTFGKILRHHFPGRAYESGANVFERFELAGPMLTEAARKGVGAVSGEVTFGLADRSFPSARYVTILRDPVQRVLSQYFFFKVSRGHGLVPPWLPPPPPELTLEQAVDDGGYILDNLQTRMLCGLVSPFDPLPSDALEQAKHNLAERFAFVGTTERFDEFIALLNLELDWPTLRYRRTKVNRNRERLGEPSADALRLLAERNAIDTELHAFATELLDERLRRRGPDLASEIEVLREALRRAEPSSPAAVRALSIEARIELALKEAQVEQVAARGAKAVRARRAVIRELERRLADTGLTDGEAPQASQNRSG